MIYFPETINTISTLNTISPTHSLVSPQLCTPLTLCMLASWSRGGVVFLDFLSSSHSITSLLFPYLGSTDAACSPLGDPGPLFQRWRPHSQGPRTLPHWDPEHLLISQILTETRYRELFTGFSKPLMSVKSLSVSRWCRWNYLHSHVQLSETG